MSIETPAPPALPAQPFRFTGSGSEYFRIWIVNLLLTVITLGIYSAWAKVRRLKYFYGNTELAGARFDYHGRPLVILKGRLFALGLFLLYTAATNVWSIWSLVGLGFLALVLPWLLRNSFRFRARNSSYRGLRFGFQGSLGGAYSTFLLHPVLMFLSLYLLGPLFHARLKQYQLGNARYGAAGFSFTATTGQFYKAYWPVMLLAVLTLVLSIAAMMVAVVVGSSGGGKPDPQAVGTGMITMVVILLAGNLLIGPLWQARVQNLIWNHTQLGPHKFDSTLRVLPLLGLYLSNLVLIILTLGLFLPWAMVRVARYRAQTLTMLPATDLEDFLASQEHDVSAAGEEAAEMFDFDIGL